jgi:uncharacterized membrane protein YbhN (UPF0104 family)
MAKASEDDMPQPSAARAWRGNAIRIVIGLALLALLYDWHVIDIGALRVLWGRPGVLALALAMALANISLEGWRWHVLLRAQGLDLQPLHTMRILASSMFFANFLPGAAGGDLIRGVYVYKAARGRRAQALLSILIDRLLGLIAFVLIGLFALLTRPALEGRLFVAVLIVVSALFIVLLAVLFLFGDRLSRTLQRLTARRSTRLTRIVGDTGMALRQYGKDWRSTGLALLLSAVIVVLAVGPIVLIATAMPFTGQQPADHTGRHRHRRRCVRVGLRDAGADRHARRFRYDLPRLSLRLHPLHFARPCGLLVRSLETQQIGNRFAEML